MADFRGIIFPRIGLIDDQPVIVKALDKRGPRAIPREAVTQERRFAA